LLGGGCDGLEWLRMDVPQRRLFFEGINKNSIDRHTKLTIHPMRGILLQIDGTVFMKIIICICQDIILKKASFRIDAQ
jgi:hypothetical protein